MDATRRCLAAVSLFALLLATPVGTRADGAPTLDQALDAIAAYAPQAMQEQGTPGLSIAITDRTHTVRTIALGYADLAARVQVTASTRFAIGSITKSMTALALLQLHDAGRLDLDAPVQRYLPWFSIRGTRSPILVHQLLSHTSGLPDDYASEDGYLYNVLALRRAHVLYQPGTSWSYSNDGYETLGAILAHLDGKPWADALSARVLAPIGMDSSSPVFTPEAMASAALGYQFRDADRPPSLHPALAAAPALDFVDPAGSVLSTPEDMARYMRLYLNGGKTEGGVQLIAPQTFTAMTRPDRFDNGRPAGAASAELQEWPAFYRQYGYGLSVFDDGGDNVVGHTGGISGYTACMQMNLTRGFGVIAFANLVEAPLHPCAIVRYAMAVLRAQSLGSALPALPAAPDPALVKNASAYAGAYTANDGTSLQISASGDSHVQLLDEAQTYSLYPRGPDLFWTDDPRLATFLLVFGRDGSKHVVDLTYGSQWYRSDRYRGPASFAHPAAWNALAGRYETTIDGQIAATRVLVVRNALTFDGTDALKALPDGTFTLGDSRIRFDSYAGGAPQRMWIDGTALYRVELP